MSTAPAEPQKSTSGVKIVLIVLLVIVLLGILACGGMAALMYFGFNAGMKQVGMQFQQQLDGNPVLEAEIGEIESMSLSFTGTAQRAEQTEGGSSQPEMVFEVDGTKADGRLFLTVRGETIVACTLETEDGRTVEIPIDDSSPADVDMEAIDDMGIDAGTAEDAEAEMSEESGEAEAAAAVDGASSGG